MCTDRMSMLTPMLPLKFMKKYNANTDNNKYLPLPTCHAESIHAF